MAALGKSIAGPVWVFGYGSLIYKVDFPFRRRQAAAISNWQRRFWQGSHDHRGTQEAPGRVVTLVPSPGAQCRGVAYLVEQTVFEHLDYREKNGYERRRVDMQLDDASQPVSGITYIADAGNRAYLGPADLDELAAHIWRSHGPSGSNSDYVLQLDLALRELGEEDQHVHALANQLRQKVTGSRTAGPVRAVRDESKACP